MKNKIVLFTINSKSRLYGVTEDTYSAIQPNISMASLAAYLEAKGLEVDMIDETFDYSIDDYIKYIHKEKPILAGIICVGANPSSSTMSMVGAIKFFEEYNKNKVEETQTFILGGHPSVLPERTLKETEADFVIIGEGFKTLFELYNQLKHDTNIYELIEGLAYYENGTFINTGFPQLMEVNDIPMVDWSRMDPEKYRAHNWHCFDNINNRTPYGVIWTTLGCPYNCSFCCINNVFGKHSYRMRDIDLVIEEIDLLVNKYNVRNIKILDELFIIKHKRIDEFCEALEKRNYNLNMWAYGRTDTLTPELLKRLKGVGLNWMSCGFESVSQKILDSVGKGYNQKYDEVIAMIKGADINICADFIVGLWEDDYDTLQATYDFACKHNFEWLNMYPCFAYPGTKMYDDYIKEGRIEEPKDWEEYALYGYKCKPLPTKYLTSAEVLEWRDKKFIDYHSEANYQQMIAQKFGIKTLNHIIEMVQTPLKRKLYE